MVKIIPSEGASLLLKGLVVRDASFAVTGVTGAVGSALAASVLSSNAHLRSLKVWLLGSNANNESLGSGAL